MAAQLERVRQAIAAAFGRLEPPDVREIRAALALDDGAADEAALYAALDGRRWQTLEPAFLRRNWSYLGSFGAGLYRTFLPALLTEALNALAADPDDRFVHSVVFALGPRYWKLYQHGEDRQFNAQTGDFSEAQYRAVCDFLELIYDAVPRYRHIAAAAARWRWTRGEHPVQAKSAELYARYYDFDYPAAEAPAVASLVRQVRAAFDAAPYPGDRAICDPRPGDDEPAEYALEFRGARWQTLHPDFLARHSAALSFFTPAGFHYYLPAFLVADLMAEQLGYQSNADPVFHLTLGFAPSEPLATLDQFMDPVQMRAQMAEQFPELAEMGLLDEPIELPSWPEVDWEARSRERFALFTRSERQAIIAYLQFHADDLYSGPKIAEALAAYWLPSLDPN